MMKTFWDFCAPIYDLAQKIKGKTYGEMLKIVRNIIPQGATILEVAAGTGEISVAVSDKADKILCTDLSEKMLNVARRKIRKRKIQNITVENQNIFSLSVADSSFDVVIASQVFHLLDCPEIAAAELKRVAKSTVILPMIFTKNLKGSAKFAIGLYKLFGFSPKVELIPAEFEEFLRKIGFDGCKIIPVAGEIPMAVAVWGKGN